MCLINIDFNVKDGKFCVAHYNFTFIPQSNNQKDQVPANGVIGISPQKFNNSYIRKIHKDG